MTVLNKKVTQFNPSPENDKNVLQAVTLFINSQDSENTRKTYARHIRDFFWTMRSKKVEDLVEEDLIFTPMQVENYQNELKESYKGKTVNNTMASLKSLYTKLKKYNFNVDPTWFDVDRADESDKESYDSLSHDEVCKIIELVSKTRKGDEKALLIRLAFATAFRKTSLLNLEYSDAVNIDGIWFIKTLGKGNKWSHKKLSDNLYTALMERKRQLGGEKIFQLTDKSINKMMKYIRSNMDFGKRTITFHSFKKASLNYVSIITNGDIKAIQHQGDHSSALTSIDEYLEKKKLEDLVVVDIDTHIPTEKFEELSHEELLKLVMSMERTVQIKLLQKMGAI